MSRILTQVAVSAALAFLPPTLPISGALAGNIQTPAIIGPCGPLLPSQAYCGAGNALACSQYKSVVSGGKTFTCCIKWTCWPQPAEVAAKE
jgi:hypothetical protein